MSSGTRSKYRPAVRGESDNSDAAHLSPSPPRTSEAALASSAFDSELPDEDKRLKFLERELTVQKETTQDLFEILRDLKDEVKALRIASVNAQNPDTNVSNPKATSEKSPLPPPPAPARNRAKPGVPQDFDGDREKGRAFFNSCRIYIRSCGSEFANDQAKITWALSYMKSGRAASFVERVLRYEDRLSTDRFATWAEFRTQFIAEFCLEDEDTRARAKLEGSRFYQGKRSVSEYIDEFQGLVEMAEYSDELAIVMKFRRGLESEIQNEIAKSRVGRPKDNDIEAWYKAARTLDLNRQANDAFNEVNTRRSTAVTNANGPSLRSSFLRVPVASSEASSSASNPFSRPPPRLFTPNAPRNPEPGRPNAPMKCFRCNEVGHAVRDCPKRFDVRAMTMDEVSSFVQDHLASMDVAHEKIAVATEVERESEVLAEDFAADNE
jgi:hypothetical protein